MASYNVWNDGAHRWVGILSGLNPNFQPTTKPRKLTYTEARSVLERLGGNKQVRILNEDGTPGEEVGYNVWCVTENRWTNTKDISADQRTQQDILHPNPVSRVVAENVCHVLNGGSSEFVVRMIDSNWKPVVPASPATSALTPAPSPTPEPTAQQAKPEAIDWDAYNGLKPAPKKVSYLRKIDPYTGLPKEDV